MKNWNAVANIAVAIAALVVGASVAYDVFGRAPSQSRGIDPAAPPEYVEGWERLQEIGIRSGDPDAPVQLVEFTDLECPACARYEGTLRALMNRHQGKVSRVFVHFPLEMHPFARRAALAAECAEAQGAFDRMIVALYGSQLDFSSNPWVRLAADAGVGDTSAFARCLLRPEDHPRIERGSGISAQLQLGGTPSLLINGFLYPGAPQDSTLERAVRSILEGQLPPGATLKRGSRAVALKER